MSTAVDGPAAGLPRAASAALQSTGFLKKWDVPPGNGAQFSHSDRGPLGQSHPSKEPDAKQGAHHSGCGSGKPSQAHGVRRGALGEGMSWTESTPTADKRCARRLSGRGVVR